MSENIDIRIATSKQFRDYEKSMTEYFNRMSDALNLEAQSSGFLSQTFCTMYIGFLQDRLNYCLRCSEYYRNMAEHSFWFMKPFVLRRAVKYEAFHNITLGRLIELQTYCKVFDF